MTEDRFRKTWTLPDGTPLTFRVPTAKDDLAIQFAAAKLSAGANDVYVRAIAEHQAFLEAVLVAPDGYAIADMPSPYKEWLFQEVTQWVASFRPSDGDDAGTVGAGGRRNAPDAVSNDLPTAGA